MKSLFGIEYGRGATAKVVLDGPALAPVAVQKMYPDAKWTMVTADPYDADLWARDRFGENLLIQKKIYAATPDAPHVMIGGDHSVNFGHFAALADRLMNDDLCLIYIDAHLDAHTPESSRAQASGAPHGANVRALAGEGDERWLGLQARVPALRPENLFYLGSRSYEPAEIDFVHQNNIFMRAPLDLDTPEKIDRVVGEIFRQIDDRPYVVSFDLDAIDPNTFASVLVPEPNGISLSAARQLTHAFAPDAHSFEFVEYAPRDDDTQSADIVRELVGIALAD